MKKILNVIVFLFGIGLFIAFKLSENPNSKVVMTETRPLLGIAAMCGVIIALIAILNIYTNYFYKSKPTVKTKVHFTN